MNSEQIEEQFHKIKNSPCWNVEKGMGSFFALEETIDELKKITNKP